MARPAEAIQQFSLRSVAFFLPFTMTFVYPFCLLLFISEIFQRDFLLRLKSHVISPFVIAFVLFFIVHVFKEGNRGQCIVRVVYCPAMFIRMQGSGSILFRHQVFLFALYPRVGLTEQGTIAQQLQVGLSNSATQQNVYGSKLFSYSSSL